MGAVALQSFGFEGQTVRVQDRDGAPWFIAQDVCACLEIVNSRDAVTRLDEDEKGVGTTDTLGGPQEVSIISESGLYALIFKSRKPAAVRFRKWVTSEVLPALRRTGRYEVTPANDAPPTPVDHIEQWKLSLATVREARVIYGRGVAARMWPQLGLPDPGIEPAARIGVAPPASVDGWAQARLRRGAEVERVRVSDMHADYAAWCGDRHEVLSLALFGKALRRMGYPALMSNGAWITGFVLAD